MESLINALLDWFLDQLDRLPSPDQQNRDQSRDALQIHILINRLTEQLAVLQRVKAVSKRGTVGIDVVGEFNRGCERSRKNTIRALPDLLKTVSLSAHQNSPTTSGYVRKPATSISKPLKGVILAFLRHSSAHKADPPVEATKY